MSTYYIAASHLGQRVDLRASTGRFEGTVDDLASDGIYHTDPECPALQWRGRIPAYADDAIRGVTFVALPFHHPLARRCKRCPEETS